MSSTSPSSSSPSANVAPPPPDGASCWLCLEEGPDDSGAPLVRNCSCRGSSGFAHLSCIIEYAGNTTRQIIHRGVPTVGKDSATEVRNFATGYGDAFFKCPNCKQDYQGDLKGGTTKAFLSFNQTVFPDQNLHKSLQMGKATNRLRQLDAASNADRIEGEELVSKLLASIEELKQSGVPLFDMIEANVYVHCAGFYGGMSSDEGLKKAKSFYQKARDKYVIMGGKADKYVTMGRKFDLDMREINIKIGQIESRLRGSIGRQDKAAEIKLYRDKYDCCVEDGNDVRTVNAGIKLANVLYNAYRTIETEQLLDKMVTTSHRLHGPDHRCTVNAMSILKRVKERCVSLECEEGWFEALQYENDGEKCVLRVKGPIKEPRVTEEEQTFKVDSAQVRPCLKGTPVELFGLKRADHLNGMIGDARDYCDSTDRFVVHLEDKGWKPVKVKPANLRVVFELPDLKILD